MDHKPPTNKEQADNVRIERECLNCFKTVIKYYDRETLQLLVDQFPITECPYCNALF